MSDEKKKLEITNDILLADIMLRITTLEKILIDKGVIGKEEFLAVMEEIAKSVSKVVTDRAKAATEPKN
jgi:TPP-dependent pyruvate/acetoin dehydrogenase alpha subunit